MDGDTQIHWYIQVNRMLVWDKIDCLLPCSSIMSSPSLGTSPSPVDVSEDSDSVFLRLLPSYSIWKRNYVKEKKDRKNLTAGMKGVISVISL